MMRPALAFLSVATRSKVAAVGRLVFWTSCFVGLAWSTCEVVCFVFDVAVSGGRLTTSADVPWVALATLVATLIVAAKVPGDSASPRAAGTGRDAAMKARSKTLAVETLQFQLALANAALTQAEENVCQFSAGLHHQSGKTYGQLQHERKLAVVDLEIALREVKAL